MANASRMAQQRECDKIVDLGASTEPHMRFIAGLVVAAGLALVAPASAAELFMRERVVTYGGPYL